MRVWRVLVAAVVVLSVCVMARGADDVVRVMTFNIEDVRAEHVQDGEDPRLQAIATIIQRLRPDILLLNEIATGQVRNKSGEWVVDEASSPATIFAETYLAVSQQEGCLEGIEYEVFVAPSNTGIHSGVDLDRNDQVGPATTGRIYGGDSLGYGEFPGHYGMALLVRKDRGLSIDREGVRTFREFLWKDMPGAMLPPLPGGGEGTGWYTDEALAVLPLSSKSHWDVPVRIGEDMVVHVLASHPTPPVFDGIEDRNGRRNHDEIRFWGEYIDGAEWIMDDAGERGGLGDEARFVIVGDLNADPQQGDSRDDPIGTWLLSNERVQPIAPRSKTPMERLEAGDTAVFRLRVDYALPSTGLDVLASGIYRSPTDGPGTACKALLPDDRYIRSEGEFPSDHFPVWVDVRWKQE